MNTQNQISSKRKYTIFLHDSDGGGWNRITINRLFELRENDYEYIYAAYDVIDEILDLRVGESMYFQPNRDQKDSKGIICRID